MNKKFHMGPFIFVPAFNHEKCETWAIPGRTRLSTCELVKLAKKLGHHTYIEKDAPVLRHRDW